MNKIEKTKGIITYDIKLLRKVLKSYNKNGYYLMRNNHLSLIISLCRNNINIKSISNKKNKIIPLLVDNRKAYDIRALIKLLSDIDTINGYELKDIVNKVDPIILPNTLYRTTFQDIVICDNVKDYEIYSTVKRFREG